jgi:hypothetical protein
VLAPSCCNLASLLTDDVATTYPALRLPARML